MKNKKPSSIKKKKRVREKKKTKYQQHSEL